MAKPNFDHRHPESLVFKAWKDNQDWKSGYEFAGEIIDDWTRGGATDAEIRERLKHSRLSRETALTSMYNAGYGVRWQRFGREDVTRGLCRARLFKSHNYNMGWWNEMIERRQWGWQHPRLDGEFDRMRLLYWDRISSGNSDDYYA